jgi:hypothetical protein
VEGSIAQDPAVPLDWSDVPCATRYRVVIKQDPATATLVQRKKGLKVSEFTSKPLTAGTYYWRARACNAPGCSRWADWRTFLVEQ